MIPSVAQPMVSITGTNTPSVLESSCLGTLLKIWPITVSPLEAKLLFKKMAWSTLRSFSSLMMFKTEALKSPARLAASRP
ncbi:hypothetical protein Pmgp_03773 [Pelotomaculum propionicicum]|uniref:Uncharacterized protein n=1 Tax=Pelotomaculum propionicicum TaxID=258475 RepID=A0A4Y7RCA1_9FIRM|nr:hypothetical protein Pmgp_03773 [Pelotomaculum propionicicum]